MVISLVISRPPDENGQHTTILSALSLRAEHVAAPFRGMYDGQGRRREWNGWDRHPHALLHDRAATRLVTARMSQAEVRDQTGSVDVRRVRPSTRARCRAAKSGVL